MYKLTDDFNTMYELGNIKYTTDTNNVTFEKEVNYYDEVMPVIENLFNRYYKVLNASKFKPELTEKWGKHILTIAAYRQPNTQKLKELPKLNTMVKN